MTRVEISTNRTGYGPEQIKNSLTVSELIEILSRFDEDTVVMFNNDNGYTYGAIREVDIQEMGYDEEEDEDM